ncbi:hypothetical protein ST201phi2-1p454 [Pseudomonas phage 201phi2-1]|uniref:Uncharacterized protein n=1 Tax=Pseudomonas phage 201phi2-1 TaxID=198110 RepID=B3FJW2_BP201|nr:hypothetical protein ST201phi2-1p454 [Pseudomonas phage 201phi2-1]ABY63277.1 hypothetical protein 201phi2-1p454 [Pseudomonas phage 201phi2-1]
MSTIAEKSADCAPDITPVKYDPTSYIEGTLSYADGARIFDTSYLHSIDAIHHYFEQSDPDDYGIQARGIDRTSTAAEVIAHLAIQAFDCYEGPVDVAYLDVEPTWQEIRSNASFIAGEFTRDQMVNIRKHINALKPDEVVMLDASNYLEPDKVETPALNKLMGLAHRTQTVIEEGLCEDYRMSPRKVIDFFNASGGDIVALPDLDDDCAYTSDVVEPSKWLMESKYLARELIQIPEFQRNFNLLVIFNAHRYLTSDQLNLTKLYRLFAKLGRINTRIVFVG